MPPLHNISDFLTNTHQFAELLEAISSHNTLQSIWNKALGDDRAKQCCVTSLDEYGSLIVLAPDAMLAGRIRIRSQEIVAKLQASGLTVYQLKVRICPPSYTIKTPARASLGAIGQRHLEEMRRMLQ
jgi:hypothetical protein